MAQWFSGIMVASGVRFMFPARFMGQLSPAGGSSHRGATFALACTARIIARQYFRKKGGFRRLSSA